MKIFIFSFFAFALLSLSSCTAVNLVSASAAGVKAVQAMTLTDSQIQEYTREFIAKSDKENDLAADDDPYTLRLNKITSAFNNRDGINIKVYKKEDVNAFATADGSIRVYSGLMDIMNDEEILGIVGHEIGHVMNKDTKDAFKNALLVSAVRDGISSTTGVVGKLTSSQLGDLGEAFFQSQYSQKQEFAADDYGYEFLKSNGLNPWSMSMALDKLRQLQEQQTGAGNSAINQLFSTHPDIANRSGRLSYRALHEGFPKPGHDSSKPITGAFVAPSKATPTVKPADNNPQDKKSGWSF